MILRDLLRVLGSADRRDGRNLTRLTNTPSYDFYPTWSPDGQWIAFLSGRTNSRELFTVRPDGNDLKRLALTPGNYYGLTWSPDSRWLAYALNLPSGYEVFVQPFDRAGERIQVSVNGGIGPVWRDDGRELYYEIPGGLMAVSMTERGDTLETGKPQKLFSIRTQGVAINQPHNVEVAAHGQKFLANSIVGDSDNAPLEVTLNWTAGLTK